MRRACLWLLLIVACSSPPAVGPPSKEPGALAGQGSGSGGVSSAVLGPLRGLAAEVCPPGPWGPPLAGELLASPIAGTQPTDLDPSDAEFHLYEGPVWLDGALYFSDFKTDEGFPSRILRFTPGLGLSVVLEDSGTNGLGLDPAGRSILGARHGSKSVVRFAENFSVAAELAQGYRGKRFNSPNDLVMRSDGSLYFTDPSFQAGPDAELQATNVFWVSREGRVAVLDDGIENPNGISISPDEAYLFVSGNMEHGYVKRYPLRSDGSVGAGEIFLHHVTIPDGMVFDCAGYLYVTEHTKRRILVVSPKGQVVGRISGFENNVTNVAFGAPDRRTLFVTQTAGLSRVELPVPGLPY